MFLRLKYLRRETNESTTLKGLMSERNGGSPLDYRFLSDIHHHFPHHEFTRLHLQKETAASRIPFRLSRLWLCWRTSPPEADKPVYERHHHVGGF